MSAETFDLDVVFVNATRFCEKYKIEYDPAYPVPSDDDLAIGNCISTAGTALATIATSSPQYGLRPSDGWLVGALAEMKFDMGALNKATYLSSWGANIGSESGPLVGCYVGGSAGAAILNVAYRLIGILVPNCDYHLTFSYSHHQIL